jgi:NAD kinase
LYQPKPVIKTFDVVLDKGYEEEAGFLVEKFREYLYTRDTIHPNLVVILGGDGMISQEGKNQAKRYNPDAIILGVKKPKKKDVPYSRGTLAQVKDWRELEKYISKIRRGDYRILEHNAVDLIILDAVSRSAFNEVLAIRDSRASNQSIKFYLYWYPGSQGYRKEKLKLFSRYFTDGLIVADGAAIGPSLGQGGYQKTAGVPKHDKGIGVGLVAPSIEKKDTLARLFELSLHRELLPKGFVAPEDSTIEFELKRGNGFIFADHDYVADISPSDLSKFQVKKSKEKVRFIRF